MYPDVYLVGVALPPPSLAEPGRVAERVHRFDARANRNNRLDPLT
jgi:hypothetical protein